MTDATHDFVPAWTPLPAECVATYTRLAIAARLERGPTRDEVRRASELLDALVGEFLREEDEDNDDLPDAL